MTNKVQNAMGKRDTFTSLLIKLNITLTFTTEIPLEHKNEPFKRRQNQIKMQVINNLSSNTNTITSIAKEHVDKSADLTTGDSISDTKLNEQVNSHVITIVEPQMIPIVLPLVLIAISNVNQLLLNVHHKIKIQHVQHYVKSSAIN